MSSKSKFRTGDRVRVINPDHNWFDKTGVVDSINPKSLYPVNVSFKGVPESPLILRDHELTLADPDVHTVLDEMDAESMPESDLAPHLTQFEKNNRTIQDAINEAHEKHQRLARGGYIPPRRDITEQEIDGDHVRGLAASVPNRRAKTLRTAESLINGDRAAAYGHPSENFGRIAALWNAQFGRKLAEPFTAEDVALALVHLKMSRLANTPGHEDSLIDACGYLALASEIANPDV